MNRLLEIGFAPAGHWVLEGDALKPELIRYATQRNVLYAFVCDGHVRYVGKTIRTLAQRMAGYRNPGRTQTTNIHIHERIRGQLAEDVAVDIFVLPDTGLLRYGQFHLNLAAALEDDIIRLVNPEWNGGRKEPIDIAVEAELPAHALATVIDSFGLTLQPTYYHRGFFNVRVEQQHLFGADGDTIELFLGSKSDPVQGTINRRVNQNGTPRIMGGVDLRNWFQHVASPGDIVQVSVLSPRSILLQPADT
jgi:hypothetical protein